MTTENKTVDRIRSVGKFKLTFINSIDLYVLIDEKSILLLNEWRAHNSFFDHFSKAISSTDISAGSFYLTKQGLDVAKSRLKISIERFEKSIPTVTFYENAIPLLFEERNGQKICDTIESIRLGKDFRLSDVLDSRNSDKIFYSDCQLRVFRDGLLSIRFEFSGDNLSLETFISLVIKLRTSTQLAIIDKLRLLLKDFNNKSHPFNDIGLNFIDPQSISEETLFFHNVTSTHTVIILESLKDASDTIIPVSELEEQPGLFGILRQTQKAISYKKQLVSSMKDYNLGYKSDEIYVTFRGTTLIVLPKHWNPNDYLSVYIQDLTMLIEYYVAKISHLDIMAASIDKIEISNKPFENVKITNILVNRIIMLRKILLRTEENLDIDSIVNHYFTRGVLCQLIEQRGIYNKLKSIKNRVINMDRILDLVAKSSFSQIGLNSALKQLKIGVWALIITLLFSLASLVINLKQMP